MIEIEAFKAYIAKKAQLTAEEFELIKSLSISRKLKKRQFLLQEGDICHYACFVAKGCLRTYRVAEDGTEHSLRFSVENWWTSDRESYVDQTPSKSNIEALEDSELLLWRKENFERLINEIPALAKFVEKLLAKSLQVNQNRIYTHISQSTEERYDNLTKTYPDLFARVPLHMIASYLGVTRETLSRIRNQYVHK
jgi:CRP-like cAMP-binding protein